MEYKCDGSTCGERITWLQTKMEQTEESACRLVAGTEFPVECLGCDPDICNDETGNPTHTSHSMTPFLSVFPSGTQSGNPTIATENPTSSPTRLPTSEPSASIKYCSCSTCSSTIWNTNANGPTCGERITWLQTKMEQTEESACHLVAGTEFPVECLGCDPDTCNDETGNPSHTPQSM